ncbi:enoyl-CoA hydratase/isomerase family protein [Camelliibacillus cellulosilyticus]|uniref:Enoyl-CoA hydratase/isomerase family protein n=1 Tax=Camelliibacillus cellulosilyticus TaxID=2174486 RepID=A0ABV9GNJ6_9BACL
MIKEIHFETKKQTAILTLENPPINALDEALLEEFDKALTKIESDAAISAVVVTGAGEHAFSAGFDQEFWQRLVQDPMARETIHGHHELLNRLSDLPKPTIALINGIAYGAGCELAMACDIRIAETHAVFSFPEIKYDLIPGWGGTQRLSRLVGTARAKEWLFTGDPILSEQAEHCGLVNAVVPSGKGLDHAMRLADHITRRQPKTLFAVKQAVDEGIQLPLIGGLRREAALLLELIYANNGTTSMEVIGNGQERES